MNVFHKAMLASVALACFNQTATAVQQESGGKPRLLYPQTAQGGPITGETISFRDNTGSMTKAALTADGGCKVWSYKSKLSLEVIVPGHAPAHLEVDLGQVYARQLDLLIDENTGIIKLVQKVTRDTPGFVAPPSDKDRQLNLLIPGPANDNCEDAEAISGTGQFFYSTIFATTDGNSEPSCNFSFFDDIKHDVWFCWTAPCTGMVNITDCGLALGDSRIAVYDGCGCPADDPIACGDDECGFLNLKSDVNFNAIAGNQYLIRVGNFPYPLLLLPAVGHIQIECMPSTNNDECEDAISIDAPSMTLGSTQGATHDPDTVPCDTTVTAPGVWYEVIGTGTQMSAETCGDKTDYDTKLSVFCRGCDDEQLCVTANDDVCGLSSRVTWCSELGTTYKILVHGFGASTGNFQLRVEVGDEPCEPTIRCRFRGACCDGESCSVMYDDECEAIGGTFFGDKTDCCGRGIYDIEQFDAVFEDISATGNNLNLGDDDGSVIPIGFSFDYFGDQFFEVGISSNGYCLFGPGSLTDFTPSAVPSQDDPDGVVAPYWTDLNPSAFGSVTYEVRGVPGARRLIVQWTNVPHFGLNTSNTFQVVFFETSHEIHFRYDQIAVFIAGFAPRNSLGIENDCGTHGYNLPAGCSPLPDDFLGDPEPCTPQNGIAYVPRWAPLCDNASPLVLDGEVNFSDLDGSGVDLDGVSNGVLQTNGLVINGLLLIDVPCATFDVQGDLVINGAIFGPDTAQTPHTGPKMIFKVCESMWMNNNSLIDAPGAWCGGTVLIFVGGDFHTTANSGIRAVAQATYGSKGGWIEITARGTIDVGFQGFLVVKGEEAGHIKLTACSGDAEAIKIDGHLNAAGWGPDGRGGNILVKARQGGIYLPGDNHAIATGDLLNGLIRLRTAWIVTPLIGPFVSPDPLIQENTMEQIPCECIEDGPADNL